MKVILIDPQGLTPGINSGLGYLAGALTKNNIDVKVIDFNNNTANKDNRLLAVKDANIVGISIKSFTMENAIKIAKRVREINKNVLIVAGGAHVALDGLNFFKKYDLFDLGIMFEAEEIIVKLAKGNSLHDIPGIIYRKDNEIMINSKTHWVDNLDEIAFPNYSVFDSDTKGDLYPLVTSRGCPYNCTYCSVHLVSGKKWRSRSVENIVAELNQISQKEFMILDDNFTMDMNRAKEFCKVLIEKQMNLKWSCPNGIKANRIDEELAILMERAGCFAVNIGIESGVQSVFEKIQKGSEIQDIVNAVNILKKAKIQVFGFFIIGLIGSSFEKDMQSVKFAQNLKLDGSLWTFLIPYPGTQVYEQIEQSARMIGDWRKGLEFGPNIKPMFDTEDYPIKQRIKAYFLANLKTKTYGAVIDLRDNSFKQGLDIIKVILKYDKYNLPYHVFWASILFVKAQLKK